MIRLNLYPVLGFGQMYHIKDIYNHYTVLKFDFLEDFLLEGMGILECDMLRTCLTDIYPQWAENSVRWDALITS